VGERSTGKAGDPTTTEVHRGEKVEVDCKDIQRRRVEHPGFRLRRFNVPDPDIAGDRCDLLVLDEVTDPPHVGDTLRKRWHSPLLSLYERLTCSDPVQPVDVIFVMAGRMERKHYGLELFSAGVTPRLILSVGRFEVSKMKRLQLEGFQELQALRDSTPPNERHFFVTITNSGVRVEKRNLTRWNTYGEALALRRFLKTENISRIMVVSTDIHMRRVALTFSKVFRDMPIQFLYCSIPSSFSSLKKEQWWSRSDDRRYVVNEMIKLAGYRVILSAPEWVASRVMRGRK
jgi:DUF218 domain-containing protein